MKSNGSGDVALSRVKAVRTRAPLVYELEFPGSRARNSSIHGLEERVSSSRFTIILSRMYRKFCERKSSLAISINKK